MAQRRMFSNRVANSAKFLQMPAESQLLYFHMILRADDDGIVESYPIIKLLGAAPDSFRVLQARGFVRELNEDQVVVIIDWLEHNVIRADRKIDSIYKHLLPADIKTIEAKARTDVEDNSKRLGGQSTDGICKVRLGKVSKKNSAGEPAQVPEYSFEKELLKLKDSERRDHKVIAHYWKHKGFVFENQKQLNAAFRRELRPAKDLIGYTGVQVAESINYCKKNYEVWTLETVAKRIADIVNVK